MTTPHAGPALAPNPADLMRLHFSFAPSLCLTSGIELGVFTHIAQGKHSAAEIARAAEASLRGTRMLLDALVGFELLRKQDGRYQLTAAASQFLVRDSPDYLGAVFEQGDRTLGPWLNLTEAIRTGEPTQPVDDQHAAEQYFSQLVRTLHVIGREPARRTAQVLGAGGPHPAMRVVDVACGSGVWGIAIAEADPHARITAQDFPGMLEHTRTYLKRHGVERQYEFLPGDLREVDFGTACYDAALLGNIVHSEGEQSARDLFHRLARALKPGGRIAIIDMVPNNERTGPPYPLLFALNMLVRTGEGDTYTLAEYTQWLTESGFAQIETADIASHSPLIVATRG